jgi:hypothetical protein
MVLRRTTTKPEKLQGKQDLTRNAACKRLGLQMPKHSLIKVEIAKRRTPHQWKSVPSSATKTDEPHHDTARPSPKRATALSPRFEGAVPSHNGTLTLELELQPLAGQPKKRRFCAHTHGDTTDPKATQSHPMNHITTTS